MKLYTIAWKNLKQNYSFYTLYLFSVSFVLMIFFCFLSFSMNEVIMEKISSDGRVETMGKTVSLFIMAFVIFYMSYSNKFFMLRRTRELGIYALLGYRKAAMLKLLTIENILVCTGGLFVGILTGSLLHKGLTAGITALLDLSVDQTRIPLVNPSAVKFSAVFVLVILLSLAFSNAKLLWKTSLFDMVRLEKNAEKPIRLHWCTAILGAVLLLLGYGLALDITRGKSSLWNTIGFSPIALLTLFCVVVGTLFFIYSFLPCACKRMKQRSGFLYRENTIIVVPKFMHRIRSNAKSLILLILLSAATLSILGSSTLSVWYPMAALKRVIPSALEFRVTKTWQKQASLNALNQAVGADAYASHETVLLKVSAQSDRLPPEYNISAEKGRVPGFECIRQSDYNTLTAMQGAVSRLSPLDIDECVLVKYRPDSSVSDVGAVYNLSSGESLVESVTVKDVTLHNPIGFGNSVGTLVISDSLYQRLSKLQPETIQVISIDGEGMRQSETAYRALKEIMPDNPYLVSAWYRWDEMLTLNSPTMLLVCFATVIFLIATGSILYFQNISAAHYDKPDYEIMSRMGYSSKMIKRAVRRQIQIYFLLPYLLGMLHSTFAIICYKSALMDDLLGKGSAVFAPILFAMAMFSLIYFIYYQLTKRSCYKITGN